MHRKATCTIMIVILPTCEVLLSTLASSSTCPLTRVHCSVCAVETHAAPREQGFVQACSAAQQATGDWPTRKGRFCLSWPSWSSLSLKALTYIYTRSLGVLHQPTHSNCPFIFPWSFTPPMLWWMNLTAFSPWTQFLTPPRHCAQMTAHT